MTPAKSKTKQPQAKSTQEIKIRLLMLGMTVKDLADRLGLARNTVSIAINHPTMFPDVQSRVRKELKM